LLFAGPAFESICWEYYIYTQTWLLVKTEGIITQLVFEHALRIRMKAEAPESSGPDISSIPAAGPPAAGGGSSSSSSSTATPQGTSAVGPSTEGSGAATPIQTLPAGKPKAEGENLTGKINNLVTTDLGQITDAREFIRLILFVPLKITASTIFLYVVLGWR
jgi:hypothetical protein